MKRYPIKVAKYFIFLIFLYLVIYSVMIMTNSTTITVDMLKILLVSQEGLMMFGFALLLSLVHPYIGYTTRTITADIESKENKVIEIMAHLDFKVISQSKDTIIFKSTNTIKKISMLFEDEIVYDIKAKSLSGNRKQVTIAVFKIQSYLINN